MGYKQFSSTTSTDFVALLKSYPLSSFVEIHQLDNWDDVRYKVNRHNQRCFRDKSNNVQCLYLEFKWDEGYV